MLNISMGFKDEHKVVGQVNAVPTALISWGRLTCIKSANKKRNFWVIWKQSEQTEQNMVLIKK